MRIVLTVLNSSEQQYMMESLFGIWVFEDGEFTNKGDGGWINWAFRGWFDRDGGHVKFLSSHKNKTTKSANFAVY